MSALLLHGRVTSHFTRVARVLAHELGVEVELVHVPDLSSVDPVGYGGHPALQVPTLRVDGELVFGAENVCRRLAREARVARRVVWPEEVHAAVTRNAHELAWQGMATQVKLVVGTVLGSQPIDAFPLSKSAASLRGALAWLEANLDAALAGLPPRDVSLFEIALFCLVEHLAFRPTVSLDPYPGLRGFAGRFGERPSARATPHVELARPT